MIPIGAHSGLTRKAEFVKEEWATYFDAGRVDSVDPSWKALLYGNLALIDPKTSWTFFSQSAFNATWLDNGASQSWYLTIAAALGGVS
jgi:endo-1,3(4)-beta-glucanase